jgi:hypothetical protein
MQSAGHVSQKMREFYSHQDMPTFESDSDMLETFQVKGVPYRDEQLDVSALGIVDGSVSREADPVVLSTKYICQIVERGTPTLHFVMVANLDRPHGKTGPVITTDTSSAWSADRTLYPTFSGGSRSWGSKQQVRSLLECLIRRGQISGNCARVCTVGPFSYPAHSYVTIFSLTS